MIRRDVLKSLAALALWPGMAQAEKATPFSESDLHDLARQIAASPYADRPFVPNAWRELTYDQYRGIRYNTDKAIWAGTDTTLEFDMFPPGLYFPHAVEVNLVENGTARKLPFDFALYDLHEIVPDLPVDEALGYSGIRLRAEIDKPGFFQEYAVFQGASYFRVIAQGLAYGLSARGLALNTAAPDGEEFPDFSRFWIEKPAPGETEHKVHALLESPSVTGIYHFTLRPSGTTTEVDVRCTLWPRTELANVGIAPLTSMFFFDETNRGRFDDFRPAVHDSDGLSIHNGKGELIWRPLANPTYIQISSFVDENPRGFGLAQRERKFSNFEDLEAHYQDRPSLWITPGEHWGQGAITLVEIPTDKEIYDNIVVYWKPRTPLAEGSEHAFSYRMTWTDQIESTKPVTQVLNTRMGKGFAQNNHKVVVIDFAPHPALPEDYEDLVVFVDANNFEILVPQIQRNPETNGPRLVFSFDPADVKAAEMRAQLYHQGQAVSEVWLYRWTV